MAKFKIGDRVICNGDNISGMNFNNEIGVIIGVRRWNGDGIWSNDIGYQVEFKNRYFYLSKNWNLPEASLELEYMSEEEKEKIKLKRLKHLHEDPFGEEIWEHMKRFKDYGKI